MSSSLAGPSNHASRSETSSDRHKARNGVPLSSSASTAIKSHRMTELNDKFLSTFYVDKAFGKPFVLEKSSVTALCFDDRGDTVVTAGNDEQIQIYSLSSGRHGKTHYSKKYGVDLIRFTHTSGAIIHASTKLDHAIRHHSLQDNKYLRYFQGHQNRVSALQMSPVNDSFLSAAVNESVRMWDLRSAHAQACMVINGHAITTYDPNGQVFALAFNERPEILLYDVRKWTQMPFSTFVVPLAAPSAQPITSLAFNITSTMLLVGTAGQEHYVIDAYSGELLYTLKGRTPLPLDDAGFRGFAETEPQERPSITQAGTSGQECGWTPDAKFVFSGSGSKQVIFWAIPESRSSDRAVPQTLYPATQLTSSVGERMRAVAFNPRSAMMVSAGDQVAFWLPEPSMET